MAVFVGSWPCLLTTILSYLQKNKSDHAIVPTYCDKPEMNFLLKTFTEN